MLILNQSLIINKEYLNEISQCTNVRELSLDEIKKRNKELYIKWWADREERRLNGEDVSYLLIPPTIGTVQLDQFY